MGIVISLLLLAAGAILKFAVTANFPNVNLEIVGVILMVIGALGIILSLIYWSTWGGFGRRRTVVEPVAEERVIRTDRDVL